ncbi:MAG: FAD-dependent thymidylate synthase [Candidatus Hadarchaeales archaeon]
MRAKLKVELVAYTPNPVELCGRAAGVSYDKEEKEDYGAFIRRIVALGHESVLEHASFTFRVEGISRALSHQWVRHRICSFTQRSQRRVDESRGGYVLPPLDYLEEKKREEVRGKMEAFIKSSFDLYRELREAGVRAEDARYVLTNATETKIYWTANARELRHFFRLRLHKESQWEIRQMAQQMFDLVYRVAPPLFEDLRRLRETGEP